MADDRNSTSDEGVDHGVLDEVSTSTTAIDLGATAQVNVILPVGYRDDDRDDDDVIADELSVDEIAKHEQEAELDEPAGDAELAGAEVEDAADDSDVGDDASGDAELDDESDDESADAEIGDEELAEELTDADLGEATDAVVDDVESADDDSDDDESDDGSDDDNSDDESTDDESDDETEIEEIAADEPESEPELESIETEVDEPDETSDDDPATEEAPADEPVDDVAGEDPTDEPVDDAAGGSDEEAADEAEAETPAAIDTKEDDTADARDDEAPDEDPEAAAKQDFADHIDDLMATATTAITLEPTETDSSTAILREAATTKEPLMVKEHSPIPAAVSADTASRVEEAARTGRASFIKSHAREGAPSAPAPQSAPEESAVLTDARLLETGAIRKPVPVDPWRRILHSITGGVINLRDGKATRERAAVKGRIAARIDGRARFVPVMSRKGGVGKTTVTALLGMALADARDDRIVAVDANPDRGTLAERIAKPSGKTVRDLVRDRDQIHGYGDMSAHVTRDETRLDVLASDTDPRVADAFSDEDYRAVADIAQHYYSLVLTDTGTGIVHSVMSATLDLADQLVIVSGVSIDEARLASETLTWLETNGRGDLAENAIVVINQEAAGKTHVRIDEVESHFRTRVRDVVRIPYDPAIATGSAITFHELAQPTRDAARRLAALVVEGIRA